MPRFLAIICILLVITPVRATTLAELLQSKGSHTSLTLELSFETLAELAKKAIKPVYSGERDDPTDALKDDKLT